ncbi:hypothetical protein [Desulfobulbus oralis]|uniref:Uncharacterized protein n=1 Tax=Desulfobulbus oralis TaxID=1986146 RepID=A0A2L1GKJ7_9BACT|nr:hypothetical protein [Desulfobulbus oralis]AVD70211.1 hypothetical protein CAY53_00875 [Desulfobulbus oralis]
MAEEKIRFLPYEQAAELVAAIQEEEDIDNPDRHILTVYNHEDRAICWFDFDEVMHDAGITGMSEASRQTVTDYVLHRIPDWVQGK